MRIGIHSTPALCVDCDALENLLLYPLGKKRLSRKSRFVDERLSNGSSLKCLFA